MSTRAMTAAPRLPGAALAGLLAAVLLMGRPAGALRLPEEQRGPRIRLYLQWNGQFLSLAARVPDPMVTGTSVAPMSTPHQDDAIEFCFAIPGPGGVSAHRLAISAAGGMLLLTRDADGQWRADPSWTTGPRTIRYAVQVEATLNDPRDTDEGYVVECAIPWEFLGGEPPVGGEIGFNVVCWMQGETEGLASWAPGVREPGEVGDLTRWGRLLISPGGGPGPAQGALAVAPLAPQSPFVDGRLDAAEWLGAGILQWERPEATLERSPEAASPADDAGRLLAVYRYDWCAEPGPLGGAPLWGPEGPTTPDQPRQGAGPWYHWNRVDWHLEQLGEAHRAGIEVLLAHYRGDEESRRTWSRTGLLRLGEALRWMRSDGRSFPLVGMMLDTGALQGVDLRTEEGRRLLYGMVSEFYEHVPQEFWAELGARPDEGTAGGPPVLLGEPEGLAGWDGAFTSYCAERFAADFDGARLVWLGSPAWRAGGVEDFYAYVRLPGRAGLSFAGAGGAPAVGLSPGYYPPPGVVAETRPRRDGRAYRTDWQRVLAVRPELVVVESWNDFGHATEIAPSRQHGLEYVDRTRYFRTRLAGGQGSMVRVRARQAPPLLRPGADYELELLVENAGTDDLRTGRRVTADHRIVRLADGQEVQRRSGAQALEVLAGQARRVRATILAVDDQGAPLPPGRYVWSLTVVRSRLQYLRSAWFTTTVAELKVPITVGDPPARAATVLSTTLPSALESGAAEEVVVRLRNDGAQTWRAGQLSLGYHWVRDRGELTAARGEAQELVAWAAGRADLPHDVAPGQAVTVRVRVAAVDDQGAPLPPCDPQELWRYRVRWDLVEGQEGWLSRQGALLRAEPVQVVARDWGVRFESSSVPLEMQAGATARATVVLANAGRHRWEASDRFHLAYTWHRWDGPEVPPEWAPGERTARLPTSAAPGERVAAGVQVQTPPVAGVYWLRWELVCEGEGWAQQRAHRRGDMLVTPVLVQGGRYRPLDLSGLTNVIAVTTDAQRARGDFDGRGRTFPAEWLPPDLSGAPANLYAAGYYSQSTAAPIPLRFPDAESGLGGVVACAGQTIPLGESGARALWVLAASTAGAQQIEAQLRLAAGGVQPVTLIVPSWMEHTGRYLLGAHAPAVRSLHADDATTPAYLHLIPIQVPEGLAVELELPHAPWVKVVAITVEAP